MAPEDDADMLKENGSRLLDKDISSTNGIKLVQSASTSDTRTNNLTLTPVDNVSLPAFERYDDFEVRGDLHTDDGGFDINIHKWSDELPSTLATEFELPRPTETQAADSNSVYDGTVERPPRLNIVIQVVGSRGDVQPFVALGQVLKSKYGHRVRIATHPIFQEFVEANGLEFFSIGGDPVALMAFMVKNPRFLPGIASLRNGDISRQRDQMFEIFKGCWRSCIETGNGFGTVSSADVMRPFVADAIIANPPSFAHIHCAERLGVPLHIMFTMPWSPTREFPHPLARIKSTNADPGMTNFVSYAAVDMMIWQGLGDAINQFRKKALGLEPISLLWAPGMASRLKIPHTYFWSTALIPKPRDWSSNITVSGFCHLRLASSYTPNPDLVKFLESGRKPIYIGFGSIVVSDSLAFTELILEAVQKAHVRAVISKGWGGFATYNKGIPPEVFVVGNVPHDWLFPRVSCVVHHGGAGTTAAGLLAGKPTVVVPFFGDQPFWGSVIAKAGAGPHPIPYKELTSEALAEEIKAALQPQVCEKAVALAKALNQEEGSENAAKSFHDALDINTLRCSLDSKQTAVWRVKNTSLRLSALAAAVLMEEKLLSFGDLQRYRAIEYDPEDGPWDPISGGASALLGTLGSLVIGMVTIPKSISKALKTKSRMHSRLSETDRISLSANSSSTPLNSRHSRDLASRWTITPYSAKTGSQLSNFPHSSSATPSPQLTNMEMKPTIQKDKAFDVAHANGKARLRAMLLPRQHEDLKPPAMETCPEPGSHCVSPRPTDSRVLGHVGIEHTECQLASKFALATVSGRRNSAIRILVTGLKFPMDFALHVAKGFHNAPKLYGDRTIRPFQKIGGFKGGLRSSGREFAYGMYDGISGVITQPIKGAQRDGLLGFVEGVGQGFGGLVIKPLAALWGLPGYTLHGAYKEIQKHFAAGPNCVHLARTLQGFEESKAVSQAERDHIIDLWSTIQLTGRSE
ncbi:glycosyltransferase family 1 protein [Lepidopterella palustris CBS 459.81]|uniref:Glycosyltransferase family 1 protein n=1 Tax=Lepidopterella palustris CBS 459.81 TaxID=1314670 RepID=A0A8E2E7B1_9PEZI|nr:glycosyltransferase family 1 protein [Lepidopterella palustris CBS 459.81]